MKPAGQAVYHCLVYDDLKNFNIDDYDAPDPRPGRANSYEATKRSWREIERLKAEMEARCNAVRGKIWDLYKEISDRAIAQGAPGDLWIKHRTDSELVTVYNCASAAWPGSASTTLRTSKELIERGLAGDAFKATIVDDETCDVIARLRATETHLQKALYAVNMIFHDRLYDIFNRVRVELLQKLNPSRYNGGYARNLIFVAENDGRQTIVKLDGYGIMTVVSHCDVVFTGGAHAAH